MTVAILLLELTLAVVAVYLAIAATLCVSLDLALPRPIAAMRIVVSWLVPVVGPVLTIRVSAEESQIDLSRRWWLRPLKGIITERAVDPADVECVDLRADAERILPGSTLTPPP
jgi:hypothetical protein